MSKAELIRIATDEFLQRTRETGEIVQRHFVNKTHGDYSPINQSLSTSAAGAPSRQPVNYKKRAGKK